MGAATRSAISDYHVGNVILTGRSSLGVSATRSVTNGLQARATSAATGGVPLFVSTDQEGGYVQVLSGPGFSAIPQALTQGGWSTATLQAAARHWGGQLAAAGVNLNLAPVADTVPVGQVNPPIGYFYREYGHTPDVVAPHGAAVIRGMAQAGVASAVKHFPGLGRVTANTDTTAGVTDYVTTSHDPYLAPFQAGIGAGTSFVMMSSAYYQLIDPSRPAVFSPTVIGSLLRGQLGFRGVVISDSLGAAQVAAWSPGARAVNFLEAGGDMVLINDPSQIPAMVGAVSARVASSSAFRAKVDAAALLVLRAKQARGLIAGVPHDYNGDGRSDLAVWRPSTGVWWVHGVLTAQWGLPGDVPVPADYNGDGRTDLAVWRPSTGVWWVRGIQTLAWGKPGDVPVVGDYNGDGRADLAIWRPSTGVWWVHGVRHRPVGLARRHAGGRRLQRRRPDRPGGVAAIHRGVVGARHPDAGVGQAGRRAGGRRLQRRRPDRPGHLATIHRGLVGARHPDAAVGQAGRPAGGRRLQRRRPDRPGHLATIDLGLVGARRAHRPVGQTRRRPGLSPGVPEPAPATELRQSAWRAGLVYATHEYSAPP